MSSLPDRPSCHTTKEPVPFEATAGETCAPAAVEIANSVRGVRAVYDELSVDPRDMWEDNGIRGAALQALMSTADVPDDQVDVYVRAGWLTLRGQVKHQHDSNAAFEAVSGLPREGGIMNRIQVITAGGDGPHGLPRAGVASPSRVCHPCSLGHP